MADDPHSLFDRWMAEAEASEPNDPNAMALATADADGSPSLRMVLLKGHDRRGFVFFTNDESVKGRELAVRPEVALLLHWKSLRRQVRIEGWVERVDGDEADAYFATRSRESRLAAWASKQSQPLDARETLERSFAEAADEFDGRDVPRPPHWGGYRVVPLAIEYWQDGPHRLHERRFFLAQSDGTWDEGLLYP